MTQRTFGFEGGTHGAAVSTGFTPAGDTVWSAVAAGTGSITYDSTYGGVTGTMACKIVTVSGVQTVTRWTVTSHTTGAIRLGLLTPTLPTGTDENLLTLSSTSSTASWSLWLRTDGSIRARNSVSSAIFTSAAGLITTGKWWVIDVVYTVGTSGTIQVKIYDGATTAYDSTAVTGDLGSGGVTFVRVGKFPTDTSATAFWVDAITHDDAAAGLLGPLVTAVSFTAPVIATAIAAAVPAVTVETFLTGGGPVQVAATAPAPTWAAAVTASPPPTGITTAAPAPAWSAAATVAPTATGITVAPRTPTWAAATAVSPPTAAITATLLPPAITVGGSVTVSPPAIAVQLTAVPPAWVAARSVTVAPPPAILQLGAPAPSWTTAQAVSIAAVVIAITVGARPPNYSPAGPATTSTPPGRTLRVARESRTLHITHEDRTMHI